MTISGTDQGRRDVPLEAGAHSKTDRGVDSSQAQPRGQALALRAANGSRGRCRRQIWSGHRSIPAVLEPEVSAWQPAVQVSSKQFAMWRQQMQMMESFHNDMILMVQMFVAMHREHLSCGSRRARPGQEARRGTCGLAGKAGGRRERAPQDRPWTNGRHDPGGEVANGTATARSKSARMLSEASAPQAQRAPEPAGDEHPGGRGTPGPRRGAFRDSSEASAPRVRSHRVSFALHAANHRVAAPSAGVLAKGSRAPSNK